MTSRNRFIFTRTCAALAAVLLAVDIARASTPPPNDECINATPIGDGTFTGTTVGATISTNGCGYSGLTVDVWYSYTAMRTGLLAVSTCGSAYDTILSVYSSCSSLIELACNDDADPGAACGYGTFDSYLTVPIVTGATYKIRVSGFVGAYGTFTLTTKSDTGQAFCLGDGVSATICPCSNTSANADLAGCRNSGGVPGKLMATGTPAVANDGVTLRAAGLPPGGSCLFFQGALKANGGYGTSYGDGVRCASGVVVRLGTKYASANGTANYPDPGDQSVSHRGLVPLIGGTFYYQVWYRNAAVFCTGATFNLSNGYQITWQP